MAGLLGEVHREIPYANRTVAKAFLETRERIRRAARIDERISRRRFRRQAPDSSAPALSEEAAGVKSELQARVNAGLNGDGTFTDRAFIVEHIAEFEKPIGDGSVPVTVVEFP